MMQHKVGFSRPVKTDKLWMVDLIFLFNFIMFMANRLMKTLGDTNAAVYLEHTPTRLSEDQTCLWEIT